MPNAAPSSVWSDRLGSWTIDVPDLTGQWSGEASAILGLPAAPQNLRNAQGRVGSIQGRLHDVSGKLMAADQFRQLSERLSALRASAGWRRLVPTGVWR